MNSIIRSISASRPSRLLVLVNPKGGSGRAASIWSQKSQPILRLAGEQALLVCGRQRTRGHLNAYESQIASCPAVHPKSSRPEILASMPDLVLSAWNCFLCQRQGVAKHLLLKGKGWCRGGVRDTGDEVCRAWARGRVRYVSARPGSHRWHLSGKFPCCTRAL